MQVLDGASLAFRYHAMRGWLLFARDPDAEAELQARTWVLREALRGG